MGLYSYNCSVSLGRKMCGMDLLLYDIVLPCPIYCRDKCIWSLNCALYGVHRAVQGVYLTWVGGQNYKQLLTIIIKDDEEYYPPTVSELVTYFDRPLSTLSNLLVLANPKVTPPSQHLYQLTE